MESNILWDRNLTFTGSADAESVADILQVFYTNLQHESLSKGGQREKNICRLSCRRLSNSGSGHGAGAGTEFEIRWEADSQGLGLAQKRSFQHWRLARDIKSCRRSR